MIAVFLLAVGGVCAQPDPDSDPKPKKEKKDKPDKDKDKKGPEEEEKRLYKTAEKTFRPETERDKWLKEMSKRYRDATVMSPNGDIDLGRWFDALTEGRSQWDRASISVKPISALFDRAAERVGATDGVLTRGQFLDYGQRFLGPAGSPFWKLPDPDKDPLDEANKLFRDLDRDGNGLLERDEQSPGLRAARADLNGDGAIDLTEYRAYVAGRLATYRDNPELLSAPPPRELPMNSAPAPVRPPIGDADLPKWFRELDTDGDGQVGLYEWRLGAGRLASEFVQLDPDGDGYLTPDEFRRFRQANPDSPYVAATLPPPAGGGQPWHPSRQTPGVANRPPK